MNLNNNPQASELSSLLGSCDDSAASHCLWVDKNGEVFVTPIPSNLTPIGFEKSQPSMFMRYETCQRGNDCVGPKAASDNNYVQRMFNSLVKEWSGLSTANASGPFYIDIF